MCTDHPLNSMSRGDFLRLTGAGLAGAILFSGAGAGKAIAQRSSSLMEEFRAAAEEYNVPVELLLAMGWVNTRWEMPPPQTSAYRRGDIHGTGIYGIMALTQNPSSNTLGEASRLTGIPEETLKNDRAANIRGGAALLAEARALKRTPERTPQARALSAVEGGPAYDAVAGVGGGEIYQEQVAQALSSGVTATTLAGEKITLPSQAGAL
jgi:hypothetical protein